MLVLFVSAAVNQLKTIDKSPGNVPIPNMNQDVYILLLHIINTEVWID